MPRPKRTRLNFFTRYAYVPEYSTMQRTRPERTPGLDIYKAGTLLVPVLKRGVPMSPRIAQARLPRFDTGIVKPNAHSMTF